ncbi:TetR family transcriptional regulator [Nocardia transvalensis]|uniref:TetR family transcriptional regulator n=1 Tax=Nocardia transvalensis TaxID=37333 RepID=UPI001894C827|nr:TetR family transcriptional regulator [Nocardia transvalensis]MBF6327916.1 TetR family transcriptional regulator [Nocardia transvalensis]
MPPDSTATRTRLLDAATAEFAAHGIAGARVERIAAAAGANKQLIYRYFGDKEKLFETVLHRLLTQTVQAVELDVDDLPGSVGRLFDHNVAHPEHGRLLRWDRLERSARVAAIVHTEIHQRNVASIETAQRAGTVDDSIPAVDLLALLYALADAWRDASPVLHELADKDRNPAAALAHHRIIAVEAARRILSGPTS